MTARLTRAHTHTGIAPLTASVEPVKKRNPATNKTRPYINNIANSSETDRENFLLAVIRPLVLYGASYDMIEDQILKIANHFNIKVTVVRKPRIFTCILGDYGNKRRRVKIDEERTRQPEMFGLLEVRETYVAVMRNKIKMGQGVQLLNSLPIKRKALRYPAHHLVLATVLSALVTMVLLDGSPRDAAYAAGATLALCNFELITKYHSSYYASCFEAAMTVLVSLVCHTRAISSMTAGILPGFLYMCQMIKNTERDGSVAPDGYMKSAFAVFYSMLLRLGLPIVSDFFLLSRLYMLVMLGRELSDKVNDRRTILTIETLKPSKAEQMLKAEIIRSFSEE